ARRSGGTRRRGSGRPPPTRRRGAPARARRSAGPTPAGPRAPRCRRGAASPDLSSAGGRGPEMVNHVYQVRRRGAVAHGTTVEELSAVLHLDPTALALEFGADRFTYGELAHGIGSVRAALRDCGVGPGSP